MLVTRLIPVRHSLVSVCIRYGGGYTAANFQLHTVLQPHPKLNRIKLFSEINLRLANVQYAETCGEYEPGGCGNKLVPFLLGLKISYGTCNLLKQPYKVESMISTTNILTQQTKIISYSFSCPSLSYSMGVGS